MTSPSSSAPELATRTAASDAPAPGRPFLARPVAGVPSLAVVVYHYIREAAESRFPKIKGISVAEFEAQARGLADRYEMATLESALAFLSGEYRPARSLCLLTFDDGLKDHYRDVFPVLRAARIQGLFFLTTGCLEGRVADVHKNHHLLAGLPFDTYRAAVMDRLTSARIELPELDPTLAGLAYPWDLPEVAHVKYLVNYQLSPELRREVLDSLFAEFIGSEREFAAELYLDETEAREMQAGGMLMGGHSHGHSPLSGLEPDQLKQDLSSCMSRLRAGLHEQTLWPFSYPYGYFNARTIESLRTAGFDCSFALDSGDNRPAHDAFRIRRIDTKDLVF